MRVRKRDGTPAECQKSNKAPLPNWYLLPPEEWQMNATGITDTDNALAELLSTKKGDDYSTTMSWIRA